MDYQPTTPNRLRVQLKEAFPLRRMEVNGEPRHWKRAIVHTDSLDLELDGPEGEDPIHFSARAELAVEKTQGRVIVGVRDQAENTVSKDLTKPLGFIRRTVFLTLHGKGKLIP